MTKSINKYSALRLTNLDENLNKNEKLIYGHLILCFDEKKGYAYPSYPELMRVLGVKRRNSVADTVELLRKKQYMETKKGFRGANNYYLLKYMTSNENDTSNKNVTSNENDTRTSNENDTPLVTETLLNNINNKLNNKLNINTFEKASKSKKEKKHKYGEYKHVLLTDEDKKELVQQLGEYEFKLCIKKLDEYIEETGKKYKNHKLTIRRWVKDAVKKDLEKSKAHDPVEEPKGKVLDFKIGGE